MIVVDSSVWIDALRATVTPQTTRLRSLPTEIIAVGDLVLTEVLQGASSEARFDHALQTLRAFPQMQVANREIAIAAARNCRALRARGITVRGLVDTLVATRCIEDGHALLYADRDFDSFVAHLGLRDAMAL